LAFPGRILKINGDKATADFDGVEKEVNISLVKEVKTGDFVIVHAGFAIQKMGKEDAREVFELYKKAEGNNATLSSRATSRSDKPRDPLILRKRDSSTRH
jgi:hydrogenase expression/formation protein HypC